MENAMYPAFSISPVPQPSTDTPVPELFHGIYGMPSFLTVPTNRIQESETFWTQGIGFFTFFSAPGQVVHLRRWAFQDVLLVPGDIPETPVSSALSFACVEKQLEDIAQACEEILPGSTTGPAIKPWNSAELEVVTPENIRVTMTAARPFDPTSAQAENLKEMGIEQHQDS